MPSGYFGGYFSKELTTYALGNDWANYFKTRNVLTMYPLGRCPLAPCVWELSSSDALWGYALRIHSEFQRLDKKLINDPVVSRCLKMGIHDWDMSGVYLNSLLTMSWGDSVGVVIERGGEARGVW